MKNQYLFLLFAVVICVARPTFGQGITPPVASQKAMAAEPAAIRVTGTVTSSDGKQPIPGVNVLLKGTSTGTSTDKNGAYSLEVPDAGAVLVFSYLGYLNQEIAVQSQTAIDMVLLQDDKQLSEVVVIGYGTANKKNLTGAITSVSADEFNQGVFTTPAQLLQGKVAGLNITKSGDPNQRPAVILRGPSTLRSGAAQEPFYVIDGVPGASIDLLAPSDIETIDVLKDASSTAIYGSRAANGVIMVTTKRAKEGQSILSYSAYAAMDRVSKRIDMLSGDELRKYLTDNGQKIINPLDDDGSNTNWQDLLLRTSYSQNHNLSFGSASKTTEYGVSVNYFKNNGILKNTSLERVIVRGNVSQRFFNNRLKLGINFTNSSSNGDNVYQGGILSGMLFYLPTVSPFNADGTYKENYNRTGSGTRNPLSIADNNIIRNRNNKLLLNGLVQVDILKGLKFTLSYSTQRDQNNFGTYLNSASGLAVGLGGIARRSATLNKFDILEGYFNYDRNFGRHEIQLLAGYSWQQDRSNDGFGVQTQKFSNDNLSFNNIFLSNPSSLAQIAFDNSPISTLRLISYYGRVQYQFGNKYLFQASLRNDGSSAIGRNNRFGLFPAISAGWRVINEDFMQGIPFVTDLKARVGYGVSGNSLGFDAFSALLIYGTLPGNSKFLSNGVITNAIGPVKNENPDLRWETTATTNIGVDFGVLKNRITASVDYYIKKTSDLIYDQYPVSTTEYFLPTFTANVGKVRNTGIEVVLTGIPFRNERFSWVSAINVAHNKNVIETISNEKFTLKTIPTAQLGGKGQSGNFSQVVQPGYPLGTFNLWHYVNKNDKGVSSYENAAGALISTQPLTTDAKIAGNAQPNLIYGWNNTFTYRNFDLNFLLRGVSGNKILNATLASLNNPADSKLQNIPRFTLGESYADINGYLISDRFLEDGSYLRLDNATFGYTLKPNSPYVKAVRFYVSGNNLFVITDYRGIDPEINIGGLTPGIDNNNYYPKTRTLSIGLNASF